MATTTIVWPLAMSTTVTLPTHNPDMLHLLLVAPAFGGILVRSGINYSDARMQQLAPSGELSTQEERTP